MQLQTPGDFKLEIPGLLALGMYQGVWDATIIGVFFGNGETLCLQKIVTACQKWLAKASFAPGNLQERHAVDSEVITWLR